MGTLTNKIVDFGTIPIHIQGRPIMYLQLMALMDRVLHSRHAHVPDTVYANTKG